jgi:hypothetical protein
VGSLVCLAGAFYLLMSVERPPRPAGTPNPEQAPAWALGLNDLLVYHAGRWPAVARALLGVAAALALTTGVLRFSRGQWRRSLTGSAAWLGVGLMLASWTLVTPSRAPTWTWSAVGLCAGGLAAVVLRFLDPPGWSQALRDLALGAVAGMCLAWAVHPLFT